MPQILIVDDDRAVRAALSKRLSHAGHDVLEATGGEEAVELFNAYQPQLIFLDASMPGMSGFEVCRHVRAADPCRRTKVFFLSGASTPSSDYVSRCVDASDADGYLRKPYDAGELLALVEDALSPDMAGAHP